MNGEKSGTYGKSPQNKLTESISNKGLKVTKNFESFVLSTYAELIRVLYRSRNQNPENNAYSHPGQFI